jgi:hypothetical protein
MIAEKQLRDCLKRIEQLPPSRNIQLRQELSQPRIPQNRVVVPEQFSEN